MDQCEDGYLKLARMISIIGHSHMLPIVEYSSYRDHMMNSLKLDPTTLRFCFEVNTPYHSLLLGEQTKLLSYVLEQPHSREMVSVIMNLQSAKRQRCEALETQLINVIISVMEKIDSNESFWLHLPSQLIYFVQSEFVSFSHIVEALCEKLLQRRWSKSRCKLMWTLLEYISVNIQKMSENDFTSTLKLINLLYWEEEPLIPPDPTFLDSLKQMAPICTLNLLFNKVRKEIQMPIAFKIHYDFLENLEVQSSRLSMSLGNGFDALLFCNAYSTHQGHFSRVSNVLLETLNGNERGGGQESAAPLSVAILDNLTVHSKMSLIHKITEQVIQHAQAGISVPRSAVIETYARLLVCTEIESLRDFFQQILPTIFKCNALGMLHILLEMFCYRLHHIPTNYRIKLLPSIFLALPQTKNMQLSICFEMTVLRIFSGLSSVEMQSELSCYFSEENKSSFPVGNEELNCLLILTLARSMHITGSGDELQPWCQQLLTKIMQSTPHVWSPSMLASFPPALKEFFERCDYAVEDKQLLRKSVDEEYIKWTEMAMSNESDILSYFKRPSINPLFLCVLYKVIFNNGKISPIAYKILAESEHSSSVHLRKFCDYLIDDFSQCNGNEVLHRIDVVTTMIWTYNIITVDRIMLYIALRLQKNSEKYSLFVIFSLLIKPSELRYRCLRDFCNENSPDHWRHNNWEEKHLSFCQRYPEKFAIDKSALHPPLPVYFSNVCLRLLNVLDIAVHRFIEVNTFEAHSLLRTIFQNISFIYKFHDRPITYLYNTLHIYEHILRNCPELKKEMVRHIIDSSRDISPPDWSVSETFQKFLVDEGSIWVPDLSYYRSLISRLSDTITGVNLSHNTDWRFNEFPNAPAHVLYVTCVELLSLPCRPTVIANNIIDVIVKTFSPIPDKEVPNYINAVGILLAALPEIYWCEVYDRLQQALNAPIMLKWTYRVYSFEVFNVENACEIFTENEHALLLAVAHSLFHHMGSFKLATMTKYLEKLKPYVRTEDQLIFLYHVFGPFGERIYSVKPNSAYKIAKMLYEMLEVVDKENASAPLKYIKTICNFLNHFKYLYATNKFINEVEDIKNRLRTELQENLCSIKFDGSNPEKSLISATKEPKTVEAVHAEQQLQQSTQHPVPQHYLSALGNFNSGDNSSQQILERQSSQYSLSASDYNSSANSKQQKSQQQIEQQLSQHSLSTIEDNVPGFSKWGEWYQLYQQQQQSQQQVEQQLSQHYLSTIDDNVPRLNRGFARYQPYQQQQLQQSKRQRVIQHSLANINDNIPVCNKLLVHHRRQQHQLQPSQQLSLSSSDDNSSANSKQQKSQQQIEQPLSQHSLSTIDGNVPACGRWFEQYQPHQQQQLLRQPIDEPVPHYLTSIDDGILGSSNLFAQPENQGQPVIEQQTSQDYLSAINEDAAWSNLLEEHQQIFDEQKLKEPYSLSISDESVTSGNAFAQHQQQMQLQQPQQIMEQQVPYHLMPAIGEDGVGNSILLAQHHQQTNMGHQEQVHFFSTNMPPSNQ